MYVILFSLAEMSSGQNVQWPKCPVAKMSVVEMSVAEKSWPKRPWPKCRSTLLTYSRRVKNNGTLMSLMENVSVSTKRNLKKQHRFKKKNAYV